MYRNTIALSSLLLAGAAFAGGGEETPFLSCFGSVKNYEPGMDLRIEISGAIASSTELSGFRYVETLERQNPQVGEAADEEGRNVERPSIHAESDYQARNPKYRRMNRFSLPQSWSKFYLLLPKNLGEEFAITGYLQLFGEGEHHTVRLECEASTH